MHQPFSDGNSTFAARPIRRPKHRAAAAIDACRGLARELDLWCRERGLPTAGNTEVAEAAVDQVWAEPDAEGAGRIDPVSAGPHLLPDELRRWPARWRYLVAELERGGMERASAVEVVRWGAEGLGAPQVRQPAA